MRFKDYINCNKRANKPQRAIFYEILYKFHKNQCAMKFQHLHLARFSINFAGFILIMLCCVEAQAGISYRVINDTVTFNSDIYLDLNKDGTNDYRFMIDTLTSGFFWSTVEGLAGAAEQDSDTHGYVDGLSDGAEINGPWNDQLGVLGTIPNGSNFGGKGNKYLGVKIMVGSNTYYGWIQLNLSNDRDRLIIIDCAFNENANGTIKAGQKIMTALDDRPSLSDFSIYQFQNHLYLKSSIPQHESALFSIFTMAGQWVQTCEIRENEGADITYLEPAIYVVAINSSEGILYKKICIQ